jgi:hypothetical protein
VVLTPHNTYSQVPSDALTILTDAQSKLNDLVKTLLDGH